MACRKKIFETPSASLKWLTCCDNWARIAGIFRGPRRQLALHRQSLQESLRELGIRRPGQEAPEDDE